MNKKKAQKSALWRWSGTSLPQDIHFGLDAFFLRLFSKHAFNAIEDTRTASVSMLHAAHIGGEVHRLAEFERCGRFVGLNRPTFWCVLIQGQVRAGFVIIAEITFEQSAQMIVIDDDHMIQALATNASDHSLHLAILRRTPWCYTDLLDAHSFDSRYEGFAVDSIAVSNHKTGSAVFRKCFDDLLCVPKPPWDAP